MLGKKRPDIPLLVVEGRASAVWLARTGADLSLANLHRMKNTPDPRDYLKVTQVMLVPSVWQELFGRVAGEAMMNGIPVIGSDRGSLPEVIGDGGFSLSIPSRITPTSRELPTREEIAPWVSAIEEIWDASDGESQIAQRALARAKAWSVESIIRRFEELVT